MRDPYLDRLNDWLSHLDRVRNIKTRLTLIARLYDRLYESQAFTRARPVQIG